MIRAHLGIHPNAADTSAGIGLWWLGKESGSIPQDALRLALERLKEEGALDSRVLPSGELLWFAPGNE